MSLANLAGTSSKQVPVSRTKAAKKTAGTCAENNLSREALLALPPDTLLRPSPAAVVLHSTAGTLAVWRSTKRYPLNYVRLGSKIFYRLSDVQEFIARSTVVVAERI